MDPAFSRSSISITFSGNFLIVNIGPVSYTHLDVYKRQVLPLSHDEKVEEIARLLGGSNITETTLKSAEELINASN